MANFSGIINIPAKNLSSKYKDESCYIYLEKGKVTNYEIGYEINHNFDETYPEGFDSHEEWEKAWKTFTFWEMDGFAEGFEKSTFTSDLGAECSFELLDSFQEQLKNACIYILADSLAKKGYKHQAVLWALYNPNQVPSGWVLEYMGKPATSDLPRYETLKNKAKLLALSKYAVSVGIPVLHETTFENHTGECGFNEYDFINMKKYGYAVSCWSSHAFGGNCNCYSHDPGYSYDGPITIFEIKDCYKKIEETLSAIYADVCITL